MDQSQKQFVITGPTEIKANFLIPNYHVKTAIIQHGTLVVKKESDNSTIISSTDLPKHTRIVIEATPDTTALAAGAPVIPIITYTRNNVEYSMPSNKVTGPTPVSPNTTRWVVEVMSDIDISISYGISTWNVEWDITNGRQDNATTINNRTTETITSPATVNNNDPITITAIPDDTDDDITVEWSKKISGGNWEPVS